MRFSNITLAACCMSVCQIVAGFHVQKNSAKKFVALPSQKHFSYSTSPFSLNAKFRLDSDYDDEDDGVQIAFKSGDLRNGDAVSSPTATFGAEAVPEEQRPANEYLDLIASPFFDWADKPSGSKEFFIRLSILYGITFAAVCWPISGATFTMDGYEAHRFLSSNVGAFGFILVFCLRLYSGWGYIGSRLQSKEIEYEETGWYDGDFEMKSEAEIARDLLLYRSQVQPVVERTKTFSLAAAALFVASGVGLNVMFSIKPIFNEYNPDMLERLVYDDKIANVAADQSNGIPTVSQPICCHSKIYNLELTDYISSIVIQDIIGQLQTVVKGANNFLIYAAKRK